MASDFPAHAAFTFLNQSRDVFVIADGGGKLRYVSPSAANLFGFKNADILGKPATLFIHPGARPSRDPLFDNEPSIAQLALLCVPTDDDVEKRVLRRARSHLADDHEALGALCGDAVAHVKCQTARRLRHRTTASGAYVPMDCSACFDGELLYIVRRGFASACCRHGVAHMRRCKLLHATTLTPKARR
jgi:PAS domain-containing protein